MAILCNINIKGLQVNNAYVKVETIGGSKVYDWAVIYGVYVNKELSTNEENRLCDIVLKYNFHNGKHLFREAYEILKREDMIDHIRSVCDVNLVLNFSVLKTLVYVGDA